MGKKFHINKNNEPALCRVKKLPCPFGGNDKHFDTYEEAENEAKKINSRMFGLLPEVDKTPKINKKGDLTYNETQNYLDERMSKRLVGETIEIEIGETINYKLPKEFPLETKTNKSKMKVVGFLKEKNKKYIKVKDIYNSNQVFKIPINAVLKYKTIEKEIPSDYSRKETLSRIDTDLVEGKLIKVNCKGRKIYGRVINVKREKGNDKWVIETENNNIEIVNYNDLDRNNFDSDRAVFHISDYQNFKMIEKIRNRNKKELEQKLKDNNK